MREAISRDTATQGVRFACSAAALKVLQQYRKSETDLIKRDGVFYLIAVARSPTPSTSRTASSAMDLGIVNVATTSTGYQAAGRQLNRYRGRQLALRVNLQKKRTKSAKRRMRERSRREQRHVKKTNHIIAKSIVPEAERTSAVISMEGLKGIRQRVRLGKPHRVALHSWAFAQLGEFIVYKARRAGVRLHLPQLRGRYPRRPERFPQHRPQGRVCVDCGA